jgi:4-amino-4-deoxy-L-arabinose transferase-like glycosyltransferase
VRIRNISLRVPQESQSQGAVTSIPKSTPGMRILWWLAAAAGVMLRVAVIAIPGSHLYPPWSGGGDAPVYVLLAQNVASGHGFTYALVPTAFRPPLLPYVLAGLMRAFGGNWLIAFRWIQFLAGLGSVYFIYLLSLKMFGEKASEAVLLVGLFFPTLIYTTGEVLTECFAAFFVSMFLVFFAGHMAKPDRKSSIGMGVTTSLAALTRFNLAALILPAACAAVARRDSPGWFGRLVLVGAVSLSVMSPWLIRNWVVFGDPVLLGTTSGYTALQSVLQPSGRAQEPETAQKRLSGWLNYDLETNSPSRRSLPGEQELDHRDWQLTLSLWKSKGWGMLPILGDKLAYFWLSTDQLLHTSHFAILPRVLRAGGVLFYWVALALAVVGWRRLLAGETRGIAWALLLYAIALTVVNLPFAEETRYRVSIMDSLIAALAGGGWLWASDRWNARARRQKA